MNRFALALLLVTALVGIAECIGNETFARESRQSDIFGIGKPSGTKRRPGGSIKYKKISVKTSSSVTAVTDVVSLPESTTLKPNKTRKLKPKTSNRHTMIYKPNKKATLSNLEEESTSTTTTTEASTTTLRSTTALRTTTKSTKTYTTTTQKPANSYAEPGDPFVRPTKRVRLRVTKPPGESAPTATGSYEAEKRHPVDPLRPIVRARISTTTPVPATTKFTRPITRRPATEAPKPSSTDAESYESGYNFSDDEESYYESQRQEYQPRAPEKEPHPTVQRVTEPPRSTEKPFYNDERERPTLRSRLPEIADELYTRPPSAGYGSRIPSKTSAETESSGLRHEEAGKNHGQQFKVSGEYIKIQARPEPPPRERPEEKKVYFKPHPYYEQEESTPERDNGPAQHRPYEKRPSENYEREEASANRYADYYSSTPTYSEVHREKEEFPHRKRYPIPPVTYEPPHLEYSPPSPPPPSRVYRPPTQDFEPPSAYYPRPAEVEDLYKYPSSSQNERPSSFHSNKQPSYRLVATEEPDLRQSYYRPRPEEHETNIYRRPVEYPQEPTGTYYDQLDGIKQYRGQVGEEISVYRRPLEPLQEPPRNQYDQRDEPKPYRGHVAELDAVRGLTSAFETFTRLVAVGQPTASDLPYAPPQAERQKSHATFERRPNNPQAATVPGKVIGNEQLRDDLKILETVLVGSPVTTTPRAEVRPISATERPRFPGESHYRVLESAVITNNNRGQSGSSPSTKLRPPSEPEASYIPIPLNGRDQWQQKHPVREYSSERAVQQQRGSPSPVQAPFQSANPSNGRPFSNYAPLDSPFTRPNPAQRLQDGRNGRLIPSVDTITDNPAAIDIKPSQQPYEYVGSETRSSANRRPKELFSYQASPQKGTTSKPEYPYEAIFNSREPFADQKPDSLKKETPRFRESHSATLVEKKPEFSYGDKYSDPFSDFFAQHAQENVPTHSYYDPTPEAHTAEKHKYLQGEHYQSKEPFPEAFVDQKPEYLQTVIYQPEDHLPEDGGFTAKKPDNDVTAQREGAAVKGVPGVDYPVYTAIPPNLSFKCEYVESTGYYADLETRCQVFHVCQPNNVKSSFLCPNGTIFNQKVRVCDWWHNVQCGDAPSYYHINSETDGDREAGNSY